MYACFFDSRLLAIAFAVCSLQPQDLAGYEWWAGEITPEDAESVLKRSVKDGSFLVRASRSSRDARYTIAFRYGRGTAYS